MDDHKRNYPTRVSLVLRIVVSSVSGMGAPGSAGKSYRGGTPVVYCRHDSFCSGGCGSRRSVAESPFERRMRTAG